MRILIFVLTLTGIGLAQTTNVLDLTQVRPETGVRSDEKVTVPVVGSARGASASLPIDMTLAWLDRGDYREYDSFQFRVTLRNRGTHPVTLPWEPERRNVVSNTETPLMQCLLTVRLDGPEYGGFVIPIASLFGSAKTPASMRTIAPGGTVEIIAPGQWKVFNPDAMKRLEATLPATVSVLTQLTFLTGVDGQRYPDIASTNRIAVRLAPPQPPQ